MSFDWREYLTLAQWLETNLPPGMSQEGTHRVAIGRTYYAAFGYAIDHATSHLDFIPRNDADDHGRLRAHLKRRRRMATADHLDRLRRWRNDCDYQTDFPGDLASILVAALSAADYVIRSLPTPANSSDPPNA